jgi:hypothetical protein
VRHVFHAIQRFHAALVEAPATPSSNPSVGDHVAALERCDACADFSRLWMLGVDVDLHGGGLPDRAHSAAGVERRALQNGVESARIGQLRRLKAKQ